MTCFVHALMRHRAVVSMHHLDCGAMSKDPGAGSLPHLVYNDRACFPATPYTFGVDSSHSRNTLRHISSSYQRARMCQAGDHGYFSYVLVLAGGSGFLP